jgi:2-keto-4-pentenoate hydratase
MMDLPGRGGSPDTATVDRFANALAAAERDRAAIPPISDLWPGMGLAEAYAIQQQTVAWRLAAGERVVGWKVGLTSKAMQEQLGVDQPDYAPILSGWFVPEGQPISMGRLIQPRVEAEIAFVLARALRGPGLTPADVLAATAGVRPAIEIIDSRIEGWKITLPDTIADMASSARVVVGGPLTPTATVNLPGIRVQFERSGEVVAEGMGSAVLGDPAAAVAWAANTLGRLGVTLEAGHVVMPGALHASVPATAGDAFRASFEGLGDVEARFE